jgi:hypothetical protein
MGDEGVDLGGVYSSEAGEVEAVNEVGKTKETTSLFPETGAVLVCHF